MCSLKERSGLGSRALGILAEQEAWNTENMWHVDLPGSWKTFVNRALVLLGVP